MRSSLTRLLQEIIDYAGLYPPANLDMKPAVARYAAAIKGREKWLLSRFVCGTDRLNELAEVLGDFSDISFLPVSVVAMAGKNRGEWEDSLAASAQAMNAFEKRVGDRAAVEAFEIRIPDSEGIAGYIRDLNGFSDADVFVEVPWDKSQDDALAALAETEWLGAKARTGGATAADYPSALALAGFLRQCVDLELPFKLTAGLHHALPRPEQGTTMHGFLNVITAATLAFTEDLSPRELERLLKDTDPKGWKFTQVGFEWRGNEVGLEDIEEVRSLFLSIGSCSIDEPLEDLQVFA